MRRIVGAFLTGLLSSAEAGERLGTRGGELHALLDDLGVAADGWVPVAVSGHPDRLVVRFVDLGGEEFTAPLYDDVVDAVLTPSARPSIELDASLLVSAAAARSIPDRPEGVIVHVGRSGSTLLCNLVTTLDGWVAVKEPEVVNAVLRRRLAEQDPARARELGDLVEAIVRSIARGVRRDATGAARRCVVKLTSWNLFVAADVIERLRDVPVVFVVRDPRATVGSFLRNPPHWNPSSGTPDHPSERASLVETFARAWVLSVEAALRLPPDRVLFVAFEDLVSEPSTVLLQVLRHLGTQGPDPDPGAVRRTMNRYSKATTEESFDLRAEAERISLDPEDWHLVDSVTAGARSAVRERCLLSAGSRGA